MGVKCFFMERTGEAWLYLRRYVGSDTGDTCPHGGFHEAKVFVGTEDYDLDEKGCYQWRTASWPQDDERWPLSCDKCLRCFSEDDPKQLFHEVIYRRLDTGELLTLNDAPPGAMYNAEWLTDYPCYCGADGMALHVVCPGGHTWHVDGQASNCTMPEDKVHKCWARHGDPRRPETLTVDKIGSPCKAGAGSILTSNWHGFLRNGMLDE